MLKEGTIAPDFTTTTTDGDVVSLSDYRGSNVVLFFYPKDDTSGCTKEVCEFRDAKEEYDAIDTVIFGVSMDDQASHHAFSEKYDLNFPLLVDSNGTICDAYGVPHANAMPHRITYLIDKEGEVAQAWESVNPVGHAVEVLEAIKEYVATNR